MIVTMAKICLKAGLKRLSINSGMVNTLEANKNGMKIQINSENVITLSHSDIATQTPYTTAAPIMPMKCSVLMFDAMNEPPTTYQGSFLPARKYSSALLRSLRPAQ